MKPPIIVDDHGDLMVFESKEDAELYLEAVDVEHSEYVAYDSEGGLVSLIPVPPHSVSITDAKPEVRQTDELRAVISTFLRSVGVSADWLREASLNQLVDKALEYKVDVAQRPLDGARHFFNGLVDKLKEYL